MSIVYKCVVELLLFPVFLFSFNFFVLSVCISYYSSNFSACCALSGHVIELCVSCCALSGHIIELCVSIFGYSNIYSPYMLVDTL